MLISASQINTNELKKIFMSLDNYSIDVKNVTGLNSCATTGNAQSINGFTVDNTDSTKSIWSASTSRREIDSVKNGLTTQLDEKATKDNLNEVKSSLSSLTDSVASKTPNSSFNPLRDEVVNARKGKNSLLEKINEIDSRLDQLTQTITKNKSNHPAGSISWYAGQTLPENYVKCDGSALSREKYPELFNIISTKYGVGDDSTTFNIPNLIENNTFVRSSGGALKTGAKQSINVIDVRDAYEGNNLTDRLYMVGGNYFSKEAPSSMEPNNISLIPCLKTISDTKDEPVGLVYWSATDNIDADYMVCDGKELSRKDYSELYSVIGDTYGAGDGSTTFKLPDLVSKNLFIKNSNTSGVVTDSKISLMDIRDAYEGENVSNIRIPLGASYFTNDVTQTELVPSSITMVPIIKVKSVPLKKGTSLGSFIWYSSDEVLNGYEICDGHEVSRTQYSELFKKIGTTYGAGDGTSTFNLPNLVSGNRFIRSYSGSKATGSKTTIGLKDVREAYEGEYGSDKLYPVGGMYFNGNENYIELHPNSISLKPYIKALDVEKVNLVESISAIATQLNQLDEIYAATKNLYSLDKNTVITKDINLSLISGRRTACVSYESLGVENVKSAFINVKAIEGFSDENVCDILTNVLIKEDSLSIHLRSLLPILNDAKVDFTLNVIV